MVPSQSDLRHLRRRRRRPELTVTAEDRGSMSVEVIVITEPTKLTGNVVNGVIILENGGALPDGTIVNVEPVSPSEPAESPNEIGRLREMLLSHAGAIDDPHFPTDLAKNLDHYLYGTPKSS